ncbi:DUF397 domain-containing protein [Amycolatopsis eburnea]|uniref:DUF397 domain-containing protein n=1 Tax=Amycolatopsis eburnea TaxID=2267691 RepID=A0A427TGA5_9PSEU|nr:DUF397 domain-containing protein [Amycolatopsis eburnea]RSD22020.1 DUF397 domain-containing protein [Amycolatopsis eburnea]
MSSKPELAGWRMSTWCTRDDHDNCVEIGTGAGVVGVRDTKEGDRPDQPTLVFGGDAFTAFIRHLVA